MIISLDEAGTFKGSAPCLIGGIVYDGGLHEADSLASFLKDMCKEAGTQYPEDLHQCNDSNNSSSVKKTKATIKKHLKEYLSNTKKYHIFAMIRENQAEVSLYSKDKGNFLNDAQGPNRYYHMLEKSLRNILIRNPIISDKDIRVYSPTRKFPKKNSGRNGDETNDRELKEMGIKSDEEADLWKIAAEGNYVTMLGDIARELPCDTHIMNSTSSIKYYLNVTKKDKSMNFRYLADIICSYLSEEFKNSDVSKPLSVRMRTVADDLTGHHNNMIWFYSNDDYIYSNAAQELANGNYFDGISLMFDIYKARQHHISAHYSDYWIPKVLGMINVEPEKLIRALKETHDYLYSAGYDTIKAEYIINKLEEFSQKCGEYPRKEEIDFWMNFCKIIICNHNGMYEKAKEYYTLCADKSKYISLEENFEFRNFFAVSLLDSRSYLEALEYTEKTLQYEKKAGDLVNEMSGGTSSGGIHLGRTISQLAQCYAFCEKFDAANESFLQALQMLESDKRDYNITLSYYLHSLIECGNKAEYEAQAKKYFDAKRIKAQFDILSNSNDITYRFGLFVWIKAWYSFFPDYITKSDAKNILNSILKKADATHDADYEHPCELIYKYCILMARHFDETMIANKFIMHLSSFKSKYATKNNTIIYSICDSALREIKGTGSGDADLTYMYR